MHFRLFSCNIPNSNDSQEKVIRHIRAHPRGSSQLDPNEARHVNPPTRHTSWPPILFSHAVGPNSETCPTQGRLQAKAKTTDLDLGDTYCTIGISLTEAHNGPSHTRTHTHADDAVCIYQPPFLIAHSRSPDLIPRMLVPSYASQQSTAAKARVITFRTIMPGPSQDSSRPESGGRRLEEHYPLFLCLLPNLGYIF